MKMRPSFAMLAAALSLSPGSVWAKKCNSQGVQWAFFNNTSPASNSVPNYPSFDPSSYQTVKPVYTSTTPSIGGYFSNNTNDNTPFITSIYGSPAEFSSESFVLSHQGYIHAKTAGTYKFTVAQSDDITLIWTGADAVAGYTRSNSICTAIYNDDTKVYGSCTATVNLKKNQFLPFRVMYGQAYYGASSLITLTGPSGKSILGENTGPTQSVVQYACGRNAKLAPKFPAWGSQA